MIFLELLNELCESKSLVDIRRDDLNVDDMRGFVLGTSAKFVLIEVVGDDIRHDGYAVVETDDVTFLRWGTDQLLGWQRILRGPNGADLASEADLSNWWGVIETARSNSQLVTFHRERLDSSTCYISDEFRFSDTLVVGRQISTDGQRNGNFALKSDDLSRVDFGARYEDGLRQMLETT
jgi:hypothetical protein